MKKYEVCYFVKEVGSDGDGQWETFAETNDINEAYEKYRHMKCEIAPGDHIEDDEHCVDMIAIYKRMEDGTQDCLECEF